MVICMKKELIGFSVCILLAIAGVVPVINAAQEIGTTSSSEYELVAEEEKIDNTSPDQKSIPDEEQEPPQPAGFSKLWLRGGVGVIVYGHCHLLTYDTMTFRWETTQGRIINIIGPIKLKDKVVPPDETYFQYWYLVHSIGKAEFILYIEWDNGGSTTYSRAFSGKVIGLFVWGVKPI